MTFIKCNCLQNASENIFPLFFKKPVENSTRCFSTTQVSFGFRRKPKTWLGLFFSICLMFSDAHQMQLFTKCIGKHISTFFKKPVENSTRCFSTTQESFGFRRKPKTWLGLFFSICQMFSDVHQCNCLQNASENIFPLF